MFWLGSDTVGSDPRWLALAGGRRPLRNELQSAWVRLMSVAALHKSDGYLTAHQVMDCVDGRTTVVDLLTTSVLSLPPWMHRTGDRCAERNCVDESDPWRVGYDFRLCTFLKRNPSKSEHERHAWQEADRKNKALRELVWQRDGGCCRYCGSGPLPHGRGHSRYRDERNICEWDHVDPDAPAGPHGQNYVLACRRCNGEKGHRTPAEAYLVLLPEPTAPERAERAERGLTLFDPPPRHPMSSIDFRTSGKTPSEAEPKTERSNDLDRRDRPNDDPQDSTDGSTHAENPGGSPEQDVAPTSGEGWVGSGREAGSAFIFDRGSQQPARASDAPDIYHGRARPPTPADAPHTPPREEPRP